MIEESSTVRSLITDTLRTRDQEESTESGNPNWHHYFWAW